MRWQGGSEAKQRQKRRPSETGSSQAGVVIPLPPRAYNHHLRRDRADPSVYRGHEHGRGEGCPREGAKAMEIDTGR